MKMWMLSMVSLVAAVGVSAASAQCMSQAKVASDEKTCTAGKAVAAKETCDSKAKVTLASDNKTCDSKGKATLASNTKTCDASKGSCDADGRLASVACMVWCDQTAAAGAPTLTMVVDGKDVTCAKQAMKYVKCDKTEKTYKVAEKEYERLDKAMKAYTVALDNHLGSMTKVSYVVGDETFCCPHGANAVAKKNDCEVKYRVGQATFADHKSAERAAKLALKAVESHRMSYCVDGKDYKCMSEVDGCTTGKTVEFAVGELKTTCKDTARVALLRQQISAATRAVAQAEQAGPQTAMAG